MERAYSRINWENEPSINTPINDINLNKMDSAIYTIDGRVVGFDTTKANQSDLLLSIKNVDYNTTTGVFTFTWQNGTTKVIDLNIEKIPVSFSMDEHGVITMTTADGTQYTADVGALIKTYTFADSTVIDFTVTTDASGNKTVTANIVDGSITDDKMQPNYLADITAQASAAAVSASDSEDEALVSEGFAVGEQNGVPVPSTSPYYHNNAKYYSEQSGTSTLTALDDVDINNPQENDALVYNPITQKWENKEVQGGGGGTWGSITGDISDQTDLQNALDLKADSSDLNNKVNKDAVTESWNSSKTYSVGEYCVYNNSIWKCLVQNSGQTPIEGTYWTLITIMGEVAELNTNLVTLIVTDKIEEDNIRVENENVITKIYSVLKNGYKPIISSISLSNATTGGQNVSNCVAYQNSINPSDSTVEVRIKNFDTVYAKIKMTITVIYVKSQD